MNKHFGSPAEKLIFMPGHPDADAKGFVNITNEKIMKEIVMQIAGEKSKKRNKNYAHNVSKKTNNISGKNINENYN